MKLFTYSVVFGVLAGPVLAHVGHLGDLAGHDHWVAGAALGAAAAITLIGALKGKPKKEEAADEAEEDASEEETA